MKNKEFIAGMSARLGWNATEVAEMLAAFGSVVGDRLVDNDSVSLHGLGTWEVRKREERVSVNPVSGKRYLVPPRLSPVFRPCATLKAKIKGL